MRSLRSLGGAFTKHFSPGGVPGNALRSMSPVFPATTRQNLWSPRRQRQRHTFLKKWPQVTMTTQVPTSCRLTAMRSDQEYQSQERKYPVAIATRCTENMELFLYGSFQLPAYLRAGDCPGNFHIDQGLPTLLSGWQSSETEAASVSYCCVTNHLNRSDLK